jgi:hypothetical protein
LLANENISVQQANFQTAFFDVESRTLGLPLWKQMSSDMYDLLIGHEVGHALYSPSSAQALKIEGVPFSYMNVIEDIRIEKAILAKYPGLVANFKRGYLEMMEMDIFGTKDRDINKMFFMDRLNLKAKGRDAVEVEFSAEEMPYVKMAMAVETFKDVANVAKAIVAWLGAKNDSSDNPEDGPEGTIEIASFDQDSDTEDSGDQSSQDTTEGTDGQPAEGKSDEGDAKDGMRAKASLLTAKVMPKTVMTVKIPIMPKQTAAVLVVHQALRTLIVSQKTMKRLLLVSKVLQALLLAFQKYCQKLRLNMPNVKICPASLRILLTHLSKA